MIEGGGHLTTTGLYDDATPPPLKRTPVSTRGPLRGPWCSEEIKSSIINPRTRSLRSRPLVGAHAPPHGPFGVRTTDRLATLASQSASRQEAQPECQPKALLLDVSRCRQTSYVSKVTSRGDSWDSCGNALEVTGSSLGPPAAASPRDSDRSSSAT